MAKNAMPKCDNCGTPFSDENVKALQRYSNAQGAGAAIARGEAGGKSLLKPWSGLKGSDIRDRSKAVKSFEK